jgi:prepilin-type N-terminal cleavage/methylation domain-containing protein
MRRLRCSVPGAGRRRGFTLVELAVAMLLIAVALVSTAALTSTSLRFQRGASTREEMITLAESKLDELRSYQLAPPGTPSWAKLAAGGSVSTSVTGYSDEVTIPGGRSYRRRWQIVSATAGTRGVTLRVEPISSDVHATRRLELRTLVFAQ